MAISEELSWQTIFSDWNMICRDLDFDPKLDGQFRNIKIKPNENTNPYIGDNCIDWWPTKLVNQRFENINSNGLLGVTWNTVTGYIRTAEMLWNAKNDQEKQALIWISAGLNEIINRLPNEWRGNTYRFIKSVERIVTNEMKKHEMWYWNGSTKNFLPNTVSKFDCLYSDPNDLYNLMRILSIDVVLCWSTWTLVNVSQEEDSFG